MATNAEYALLSAYANSPMLDSGDQNTSLANGTGGQDTLNFLPLNGWNAQLITLEDIEAARPGSNLGALSTADLGGMAAFVFTKGNETVIAFRGTQADEGGLQFWEDAIADIQLANGKIPQQVVAAYYFYMAALALPGVSGTGISFTGHSLGGALASIMACYTGGAAVVFDPAPNVAVANALRTSGSDAVMWLGDTNVVIWPEIPASTAAGGVVERIISAGDPISLAFEDNGGGMTGDTTTLHLNFDRDVFADSDAETALGLKSSSLHSVYLVALQQKETNALGIISDKLLDLMTQVFNDDVNLRHEIAERLNVIDPESNNARYDLFLRQMVDDTTNKGGNIFDAWLGDLNRLTQAAAGGRLSNAGRGVDPGIKDTFEWVVMRALIQSTIHYAAQESIAISPNSSGIISRENGSVRMDMSKITEYTDNISPEMATLGAYYADESRGRHLGLDGWELLSTVKFMAVDEGVNEATTLQGNQVQANGSASDTSLLIGFGGNDTLIAGSQRVIMSGGEGYDTAIFSSLDKGISITISDAIIFSLQSSLFTVYKLEGNVKTTYGAISADIENIFGTTYADEIYNNSATSIEMHGGGGIDKLFGGKGADRLYGDAGNDILNGADGDDILYSGSAVSGEHDELTGGEDSDIFYGEDGTIVKDLEKTEFSGTKANVFFKGLQLETDVYKNSAGKFIDSRFC